MSNPALSLTFIDLLSHQSGFDEGTQFVRRDILDQLDLLLCCVSDYVLMK